jgi:menaquinone-dependent protoporphyrinogen oxidase
MARILMVYGTGEGQARRIVEFAAARGREAGHRVEVTDAAAFGAAWVFRVPDAILVAASVRLGRHDAAAQRFVAERKDLLEAIPAAFLSVSLSAAGARRRAEAEGYLAAFLAETGWRPARTALVAGALRYSRYGLLKRMLVKRVARDAGLATDSSRDHEYTDWEALGRFVAEFLAEAAAPAATPCPAA